MKTYRLEVTVWEIDESGKDIEVCFLPSGEELIESYEFIDLPRVRELYSKVVNLIKGELA